ncbi:TPA: hypothetical protein ACPSKB_000600 [Legionella feeleii]|uniref:Coiled-coil protein n=1 Tax=Legionella feeleii TaxID=453 RepID=A0A378ITZ5_9GAMM|nr:hypothetical protein [Legionella feeleii]STX38667.1 Uncharacterised protein [Legionella feeleii]
MRFFSQLPPLQIYKTLYQMTLEELEELNRSYEPEFVQLGVREAQEERNLADYRREIATLRSHQENHNPPELSAQITTFVLAIKASEKKLERIQQEVTALANELRKVNAVLAQKRKETIQHSPEEYSPAPTSPNSP